MNPLIEEKSNTTLQYSYKSRWKELQANENFRKIKTKKIKSQRLLKLKKIEFPQNYDLKACLSQTGEISEKF